MLNQTRTVLRKSRLSLLLFFVFFSILNTRTLHSIDRFPADPGYDYLFSGATNGIVSWFDLDPYVHFGAHFLSWMASFAPLESQAVILSTFVHVLWSVIGVGIFFVLSKEGFSRFVSILSSLSLALCPAAAESSLANVGNIKWPMLIFAIILVSSNQLKQFPKLSFVYLFLTGITNPLTAILFLPLMMNFISSNKIDRKLLTFPIVGVSISFIVQALTVGTSGLGRGAGGAKVLLPWQDMGLFWWFGLLSPTIICAISLVLRYLLHLHPKSQLITRVSVVAPLLAIGSYIYGGIGDRYFVAPMVISWFVSIAFIADARARLNLTQFIVLVGAALLFFSIPTIKWFNSSWYLKAGPSWSDQVNQARLECSARDTSVNLNIGDISFAELPCTYVSQN